VGRIGFLTLKPENRMLKGGTMKLRGNERGQVLIFITGGLIVLLCFMGLAVDAGVMYYKKRALQTVADSAAIGGASELQHGGDDTAIKNGAVHDAALNGNTLPASGVYPAPGVYHTPQGGPHTGDSDYVEVIAGQSVSTYFIRIIGYNSINVKARAVAYQGSSSTNLIYALGSGINANGAVTVNVNGGIIDDGNLNVNGHVTFNADSIGVAGAYNPNGSVSINPTPTKVPTVNDPLTSLIALTQPAGTPINENINGSGTFTLNPGVYSNLNINGTPTVTFNPGIYYLQNGMSINGSANITGTGVMFYNSGGAININGGNSVSFSAPTTGTYAGILFFQARNDSSSSNVNGGSNISYTGTLYFPDATLNYNGGGNVTAEYTILVASSINFNGNTTLNDDFHSLPNGPPISGGSSTKVALVE
jgi:hypothetical protein